MLKKEFGVTQQRAKEAEKRLESVDSIHNQAMYDMRLQLEDKARKQMVGSADCRSPTPASCR